MQQCYGYKNLLKNKIKETFHINQNKNIKVFTENVIFYHIKACIPSLITY